ncbi:MAG: aspartate--ammonia ligase [Tissierellia bacterium]|nr:aspartate--ammonia ligase [Tissierellia bacterium]
MLSDLNLKQTQIAIKRVKDFFERDLSNELNLTRVSAPLFVRPETGLNDNLSGKEKAVNFKLKNYPINLEIVQSLAKWKRKALKDYGFGLYEGIYTDMNAIRPEEILDPIHSIYVDQWDWEVIISKEDRNIDYLKQVVNKIYNVFKSCEVYINGLYPGIFQEKLPSNITYITAQELEDLYPDLDSKAREREITKKYKAVFLIGIGNELKSGKIHDTRSPDYDDWELNGDILFWNPVLNDCLELSSMGIRVDEDSIIKQLSESNQMHKLEMDYHDDIINKRLPYTIGGGIGQSRICMYFLEKKHIGEVQASVWPVETIEKLRDEGIELL